MITFVKNLKLTTWEMQLKVIVANHFIAIRLVPFKSNYVYSDRDAETECFDNLLLKCGSKCSLALSTKYRDTYTFNQQT